MSSEHLLLEEGGVGSHERQCCSDEAMQNDTTSSQSQQQQQREDGDDGEEAAAWIFEELPTAEIVSVSRYDNNTGDISPMLLSYTIEFQYKQFKWQLLKKASQVLYLHFALKRRAIMEDLNEKQEQVREWLHSLGIGDHTAVVQDEPIEEALPSHLDNAKKRYVPSRAALPILRPAIGGQKNVAEKAKIAMQGYLNHFLGDLHLANSREVCKFLEVSKLSFAREYGPKLKEDYVMVKHLNNDGVDSACHWVEFCASRWQKVWAVLKPGFLALLEDPFDTKVLDIIVFDVLSTSSKNGKGKLLLANELKEQNPLRCSLQVSCGNRSIKLRTTSSAKVKEWVGVINDAAVKPPEGWCHPHRFGSYAPPRGLTSDGTQAQWFIDGKAAFEAIALSIEDAKSEIFITGWWLCPELYLRRPFHNQASSRLDALLEEKAKKGVRINILIYKEVSIALKINSSYSKRRLVNIHENVRVLRYPDHISSGVYLWSHHEKLVIVDYKICFIGGLDLCFGRYDTLQHKVGDGPASVWPGKDYYNPRELEPNSWEDAHRDELDRKKYPRMPWHDVHCALWGPPCLDIARHFVQRWNFAKRNKAATEEKIPLLMPHHHMITPHHMVIPHYMGTSGEVCSESANTEADGRVYDTQGSFPLQSASTDIPLLLPQEVNEAKTPGLLVQSQVKTANDSQVAEELCHHGAFDSDNSGQVGERVKCRCQVIRSVSLWSAGTSQTEESIHTAYCLSIENAEHYIYIENQFFISGLSGDQVIQNRVLDAIYKRILRAHKEQKCFRVIVVIPLLPGFQGGLDDNGAATVRALTHWQYRTICRGKESILHNLNMKLGSKTNNYISFYGLRSYGRLFDGSPLVTSQVYVHSKVMIIDDRATFIGSSNINDRSLLGSRDSEIGVLIEDEEFIQSSMNGEPWRAGKFSHTLRVSLWSEHLGLSAEKRSQVIDPVADSTYKDLWLATAEENAIIYQEVFACIPNDTIHSRSQLRQSMALRKQDAGHTTIDLGVATDKLEISIDGEVKEIDPVERLNRVRGFLVSFPLEFMREEDLRPTFNEGEFFVSPHVFL